MKKLTGILTATIAVAALFLGANTVANADTTITVGASAAPHAEILRHVQPQLKKEGINKVNLVAFTSNELGNGFWKNMGWTFRKDMNYYEFDLNPENVTVFNP